MHNLKERMEPICLTDAQKERILRNVKEGQVGREHNRKWKIGPLIVSGIVAIAMLFLMVNLLLEPSRLFEQKASSASSVDGMLITRPVLLWSITNSLLLVFSMHWYKKCLQDVKRWQTNARLQKLRLYLEKWSFYIGVQVIGLFAIWGGALLLSWALFYVQAWFSLLIVLCILFWEIHDTREKFWCHCPHCKEPMTRKAIMKKRQWAFREKCDACHQPIFVDRSNSQTSILMYAFPAFGGFGFNTFFGLHYVFVVLFILTCYFLFYYFILPYTAQFVDKDDQKLW